MLKIMIRKIFLLLAPVIIAAISCQYTSAQVITKYGDDVSTLDGIIKAYYAVVTVKKGEKPSYERDSLLHLTNAGVGGVQMNKEGIPVLKNITLKEFHRLSDPMVEKEGFYENEISRKVEKFGAVYHVWSTYESKLTAEGEVTARGINSIELFFDGKRFWITSWIFDEERKDNPLPKEYLSN